MVLVTGGSSGIGFETSLLFAEKGYYVISVGRNEEKLKNLERFSLERGLSLEIIKLDVNDENSVRFLFKKISDSFGGMNVLVNNAGFGLVGPLEDLSMDEIKSQFETNFFSAARLIQLSIPLMRRVGNGKIINVSSIAGRIGFPLTSAYVSSKFALEGLSESIRYELKSFGIDVVLIEPGVIKTDFGTNMTLGKNISLDNSFYQKVLHKRIAGLKTRFQGGLLPSDVARLIFEVSQMENPGRRYVIGSDAKDILNKYKETDDHDFENFMEFKFLK